MVMLTRKQLQDRIAALEAELAEALTLDGQHRIISAFEDKIASLQYARASIQKLDKDYGMDSSEHIQVLNEIIDACIIEAKSARKGLKLK